MFRIWVDRDKLEMMVTPGYLTELTALIGQLSTVRWRGIGLGRVEDKAVVRCPFCRKCRE